MREKDQMLFRILLGRCFRLVCLYFFWVESKEMTESLKGWLVEMHLVQLRLRASQPYCNRVNRGAEDSCSCAMAP